jgi:hypothetical protein
MPNRPKAWLDHFVVGIDNLETGVAAFEAMSGVHPTYGGEHPSLGTHNAVASLGGDQYLEILAPRPGAQLSPLFAGAAGKTTLTPILWAAATDDIGAVHEALTREGFAPRELVPGSRVTSDGETLRWSMFMMEEGSPANSPFFIEWHGRTAHPSVSAPQGCILSSFSIGSADPEDLSRLLGVVGLVGPTVGPGETVITLQTPQGRVALASAT